MAGPIEIAWERGWPSEPHVEITKTVLTVKRFRTMADAKAYAEAEAGESLGWHTTTNEGGKCLVYSSIMEHGEGVVRFTAEARD